MGNSREACAAASCLSATFSKRAISLSRNRTNSAVYRSSWPDTVYCILASSSFMPLFASCRISFKRARLPSANFAVSLTNSSRTARTAPSALSSAAAPSSSSPCFSFLALCLKERVPRSRESKNSTFPATTLTTSSSPASDTAFSSLPYASMSPSVTGRVSFSRAMPLRSLARRGLSTPSASFSSPSDGEALATIVQNPLLPLSPPPSQLLKIPCASTT
mmetsp:Transcript_15809/g.38298  ORF Transcript_15809/g.38298 Transcript_15809/m.38298 type:complete len:219 (-) Transcript_15809:184-840(-)